MSEERKETGMRVSLTLLNIDDLKNEFDVDFELNLHYAVEPDPNADGKITKIPVPEEFKPEILFYNGEEKLTQEFFFLNKKEGVVFACYNWTVTFREHLELRRFPFDRQILSMAFFSTNCYFKDWSYSPIPEELLINPIFIATPLENWTLVDFCQKPYGHDFEYYMYVSVERRVQYYWWNIILILFLLVMISFTTVALSPSNIGDRQGFTLTLILTAVAYKYVIAQQLPKVNYLTTLDKYVVISFLIIGLGAVENFVLAFVAQNHASLARRIDIIYTSVLAGFWILMHIFFLCSSKYLRQSWEKTRDVADPGYQQKDLQRIIALKKYE